MTIIRKSLRAISGTTKVLDADQGIVEAYVNTVGVEDLQKDHMVPGCWRDVIASAAAGDVDRPSTVWGHDWNETTGIVLSAVEVAPGDPSLPEKVARQGGGALKITAQYNLETQRGREAFSDIKFGAIKQWSVGFVPDPASIRWEKGVRFIAKVSEWPEVSNVLVGASPGTTTTATKDGRALAVWSGRPEGCTCPAFVVEGCPAPEHAALVGKGAVPRAEYEHLQVEGDRKERSAARLTRARELIGAFKSEWSTAYINDLPDSAFAYIEPGAEKDAEGKTMPRSKRHFPHHDDSDKVDERHVSNALGRIPQSDVPDSAKDSALAHVKAHAKKLGIEVSDDGKSYRVDSGEWVALKATTHSHYHFHPDGEAHSHSHTHSGDVAEHDSPATKVPHAHTHAESEDGKAARLAELKDGEVPGVPALPDDEAMHYGPLLQTLDGLKALIAQECAEPGYGEFGDIIALCCVGQDLLRWVRGESSEYGAMPDSYSIWDLFDAGREALEEKAAGESVEPAPNPPADLRVSFLGLSEDEIRAELHTAATEAANSSTQPNVPDHSGEQDGLSFERRRARPHPLRFGG